ncbi:retron system putative HNH endonuclease [Oscillatoria salina]|uniref:retron system putative HNH endonuclease n=1 Tax=Oscillatoria salina TaxID=331517 RepID=UPI0013BC9E43|nr:retron system putative HNH endonuclease [Oscillatoria salina]MBZ8180191.1 TIGR02646 family protein [Oscillatoria salina IIICB1]NET90265.1 TIGR02646 family protein [Kamptonema sp. SIO1D9]
MRYIKKGQEPQEFTEWKASGNENWQPNWDNFQKPEKPIVHDALLQEQGFICCYCGRRITRNIDSSHLEHFQPRTQYPELALEYSNLLASCQGESEKPPPIPVHCGHKKGEWYEEKLIISPLKPNCVDFFRYTVDGQFLPTEDSEKQAAAETTIEKLGLNIPKLRAMREKAIEGILDGIEFLTNEEIQQLIDAFQETNSTGEYEEFNATLVYILKEYS